MSCSRVLLCVILPPLAVIDRGCGSVAIVTLLTLVGWVPGVIAALVITKDSPTIVVVQPAAIAATPGVRRRWPLLLVIILACVALTCLVLSRTPSASQFSTTPPTRGNVSELPTTTPIARITSTTMPTVTAPTETPLPVLPGLQPADVTVNLEDRGFTCSSPTEGPGGYVRTCSKDLADGLLRADIYSPTLSSVDTIDAAALFYGTPDDALAIEYLGFLATMPYDGAEADRARKWVEATLPTLKGQGDVRELEISGVTFQLFGIPTARNLQIAISLEE